MRRALIVAAPLVLAVSLTGCGNSRAPVPSLSVPAAPGSFSRVSFPDVGVSFRAPHNWVRLVHSPPLFDTLASGPAAVALWRYSSKAPPPAGGTALASARARLINAARADDPTLELIRSKLTRIGGAVTVVLDAIESISGRRRRVRSFHVFVRGAEIVLDEYAPVQMFHAVDHSVFSPLNHSLTLDHA